MGGNRGCWSRLAKTKPYILLLWFFFWFFLDTTKKKKGGANKLHTHREYFLPVLTKGHLRVDYKIAKELRSTVRLPDAGQLEFLCFPL